MLKQIPQVLAKLKWMKENSIWPNGLRYLWTDAYGLILYLSLYKELKDNKYLENAEHLVNEVYRVLGRKKGIRIGEAPDRDGQYYHYLTKWMYALNEFGKIKPEYHEKAVQLVKDIHPAFVAKLKAGKSFVWWKMKEDLSGPYPGYGKGGLDHYQGYVIYKLIDEKALSTEIEEMRQMVEQDYPSFICNQDLGIGDMLWTAHFFPNEKWAGVVYERGMHLLDLMWVDVDSQRGYFKRYYGHEDQKIAFSNYGVSVGLQAVNVWKDRYEKLNKYFENYHHEFDPKYDTEAITHVMACTSYFPGLFLKSYNP